MHHDTSVDFSLNLKLASLHNQICEPMVWPTGKERIGLEVPQQADLLATCDSLGCPGLADCDRT